MSHSHIGHGDTTCELMDGENSGYPHDLGNLQIVKV